MTRPRLLLALLAAATLLAPSATRADDTASTRTGWFADQNCATSRKANGKDGPPGRTCTRECIRKGVPVVFIDEKSKKLYRVTNPAVTRDQECNHVEITGTLDQKTGTLKVATVKVLETYVAKCAVQ